MRDKLDVIFPSVMSRASNCICDACHDTGKAVKLKLPTTLYFDGNGLTTKYQNYWLCDKCVAKLDYALRYPKDEGSKEGTE